MSVKTKARLRVEGAQPSPSARRRYVPPRVSIAAIAYRNPELVNFTIEDYEVLKDELQQRDAENYVEL